PVFGWRAGRFAAALVREGQIDIVHAFGASGLGYALSRGALVPLVFNPQGLEEFGATGSLPFGKWVGYWPLRGAVRICSRHAAAVIATDRSLERTVQAHLSPTLAQLRTIPNGIDLVATGGAAGQTDGRLM